MPNAELICQPFGVPRVCHRDAALRLLNLPGALEITLISAFVLGAAVEEIEPPLVSSTARKLAIVGIDNGVSSVQGLERLFGCVTELWVIRGLLGRSIMHSKILMSVAPDAAMALIGSANLTFPGLFNNIETSVELKLRTRGVKDAKIITGVRDLSANLIGAGSPFSSFVATTTDLRLLLANGLIEDETIVSRVGATGALGGGTGAGLRLADLPYTLSEGRHPSASPLVNPGPLLWRKANVPNSDAQVVPPGTNPTGVLRFSQAQFVGPSGPIDSGTYFRNNIFGSARWRRSRGTAVKEEAVLRFRIRVRSRNLGSFNLTVSHAEHRVAGQGNVPTLLHWGPALAAITKANVAGATLSLYGPDGSGAFSLIFA